MEQNFKQITTKLISNGIQLDHTKYIIILNLNPFILIFCMTNLDYREILSSRENYNT